MTNKEKIINFVKEVFGARFETEAELEKFAEQLLENANRVDEAIERPRGRIWKKEEIEEMGIEVTPVKWKKLD